MNPNSKLFLTALALAALTAGAWAQNEVASSSAPTKEPARAAATPAPAPVTAADVQALKDAPRTLPKNEGRQAPGRPASSEPCGFHFTIQNPSTSSRLKSERQMH